MSGETDLGKMISSLSPVLLPLEYVFCTFENTAYGEHTELEPLASMRESEGLTLVVPKTRADEFNVPYQSVFRCITLELHSSLDAVGLTAAFAGTLTLYGISANVIAGYYHDHIFVKAGSEEQAMQALTSMSK